MNAPVTYKHPLAYEDGALTSRQKMRRASLGLLADLAMVYGFDRLPNELALGCSLFEEDDPLSPPLYPAAMDLPPPPAPPERDILNIASPQTLVTIRLGEKKRRFLRIIDEVLTSNHEIVTAKKFDRAQLWSPQRAQWLVNIRHEIWWRAKREIGWSFPQIAKASGDRDHTTVLHGVRMFEKKMKEL